jgi:AraC family transcriptional regulator
MDWQKGMNEAIDYIEDNLIGDIDLSTAARFVGCSVWEFQRIFSFLGRIAPGEYIRQRRLTMAAADIQSGDEKIIDIAVKYGYDSPAAFSRAFSQLHGIAPSLARSGGDKLKACPKLTFEYDQNGWLNRMSKYSERGYVVRENGPIYFCRDMDKTLEWFDKVLGWYGDVVARDENGIGEYGCVFDYPGEVAVAHITPFRGFHLFTGEPVKGWAGMMMVDGVDALYKHVRDNGWDQITEVTLQSWGARECRVTTPDGCVLRFFEAAR